MAGGGSETQPWDEGLVAIGEHTRQGGGDVTIITSPPAGAAPATLTMAVVTSPSREISSSEPLKDENAPVPQRENRAGAPSPGAVKLKEEPWTSCQEVRSQIPAAWRGPPGSPPTCCAVQALPGDREFQTRLRTPGKAVLQGSHHLLGDGVAQTEVPCLERRGLALPGSSHLMRRVTRSNNEFVRGCCSILSCHRDNKFQCVAHLGSNFITIVIMIVEVI